MSETTATEAMTDNDDVEESTGADGAVQTGSVGDDGAVARHETSPSESAEGVPAADAVNGASTGDSSVGADPVGGDSAEVDSVDGDSAEEGSAEEGSAEDDSTDEGSGEDDSAEDGVADGATSNSHRAGRGKVSLRRLEEEGEVAADYLEELLDIVDLDGDIDIDVENGRASVAIVAEDGPERELRRLVGSRGEVLEALQELARLAVQARTGERSRLMLDIAGFRAARRRKLEDIAARACQEVKRSGEAVRLEPMTAFERKVVHDVVAEAGLISESEGQDPGRRVVIHPASA